MTDAESRIAELEAELAKEKAKTGIKVAFGNKQNVKVNVPGQRFPVTLYAPDWMVLIDHIEEVRQFIVENEDKLSWER